jgi:hypothetical protein
VAQVITSMIIHFLFHICLSLHTFFSASCCMTLLSAGIGTPIRMHVVYYYYHYYCYY